MASAEAEIRHVFGFTFSWRAAPPIIVQLSDAYSVTNHVSTFFSQVPF